MPSSRNKLTQEWVDGFQQVKVEAEFNSFSLVELRLEINFHGGGWVAGWIIEE